METYIFAFVLGRHFNASVLIPQAKEAKRLKEFLEDYDDDRDDPKYYRWVHSFGFESLESSE